MNHNPQPKNTIALLNREVILRCHKDENVDIPVSWKFYDFGKTQNHGGLLISNRGRVHSPFNDTFLLNRTSPGQFDLVIPRVVAGNAGIYECTKSGNNTPTAHLTILDGERHCNQNKTQKYRFDRNKSCMHSDSRGFDSEISRESSISNSSKALHVLI